MRKYILFASILAFCLPLFAQKELGKPFVRNYLPKEYKAETQNWSIVQDGRGIMYFGNNIGILEFDGTTWRLIQTPNKSVVRSLAIGADGRIYAGASGDVGYLAPDSKGNMGFVSLADKLPADSRTFADVWGTRVTPDGVFFGSLQQIMLWDTKKMSVFKPEKKFHLSHAVEGRFYVTETGKGFKTFAGGKLVDAQSSADLLKVQPFVMLPYRQNDLLLGNLNNGLYLWEDYKGEGGKIAPVPFEETNPLQVFFKKNQLYQGALLKDRGIYLFNTYRSGTVVADTALNILQVLDKNAGLTSNTAYGSFVDREGNLWEGHDAGVSKVDAFGAIRQWGKEEYEGNIGAMGFYNGTVYIGTGVTAYYLKDGKPEEITYSKGLDSRGQTWGFVETDDEQGKSFLMASYYGLGEIKDGVYSALAKNRNVAFSVAQYQKSKDVILAGQKDGLMFYQKDGKGGWKPEIRLEGLETSVKCITEDSEGNLWLGSIYDGIFKVTPDFGDLAKSKTVVYDTLKGLPSLLQARAFIIGGQVTAFTEKGIYLYDKQKDSFAPHPDFVGFMKDGRIKSAYLVAEDREGNLYIAPQNTAESEIALLRKQPGGGYGFEGGHFLKMPDMEMEGIFVNPDDGSVWIGGSEGIFRFDPKLSGKKTTDFNTLIRQVRLGEDSVIFNGTFFDKTENDFTVSEKQSLVFSLPFENNALAFDYSATSFADETGNLYTHFLEGFDEKWSAWSPLARKEYTNLPYGEYSFRVKSKNNAGTESTEAVYRFVILKPWYATYWAWALYVIAAAAAVWGIVLFNTKRLQTDKLRLENTVKQRTVEILSQKEEIEAQADNLKELNAEVMAKNAQVEKSYNNVKVLSDIGQKITSELDLNGLNKLVYNEVNQLMPAAAFGVGVYNEQSDALEFRGFIEKGEALPYSEDAVSDHNSLASQCFKQNKPVLINDFAKEVTGFVPDYKIKEQIGEVPESLIYLPLLLEGRSVGVITVQSFEKNAYTATEIALLGTLASYVAIAVDNARAYTLIQETNNRITDSIRYAETIQRAVLPFENRLTDCLTSFFVIFKPKDIVSGDFYWFSKVRDAAGGKDLMFAAAIDCTGHGVPGAFMSMIGNTLLNEIINQKDVYDTCEILELLDSGIHTALHQAEKANDDGMDVCLVKIEKRAEGFSDIAFTGAKRPLLYFDAQNALQEIKGDNRSIGGIKLKDKPFTVSSFRLEEGRKMYLTTDGFADQSSPDRKKFGTMLFKELLEQNADRTCNEQKEVLLTALAKHQGNAAQRDDITVLCLKP